MANFLDKFKINTAQEKKRKFDLSCEHITTNDFMRLGIAYYHHSVPGEKLVVDFRAFSRLAPMPVPTFGRANMNCRAFFVPFRVVWSAWNDFITDSMHTYSDGTSSIPSSVPLVGNSTICDFLAQFSESGTVSVHDFEYTSRSSSAVQYRVFSKYSRGLYKILVSLGYNPCFNTYTEGVWGFSALPLLAVAKVYLDWYYPSAYVGDPTYNSLVAVLTKERTGASSYLEFRELALILDWLYRVNYDSDYFVSAFDQPTGPAEGLASTVIISNPDGAASASSNDSTTSGVSPNTPKVGNPSGGISQFTIDSLKRLTDYMKRHQLAGARAIDRYLARFGVTLAAEKMNRSVYLGNHQIPLMTGDVMSTASSITEPNESGDSWASPIGSYAGKGFLVGKDGHFEYETDEYGMFFILYSIVPEVGYYQGFDRHNIHTSRLDFFTPEFDGVGTRAIASGELYAPMNKIQGTDSARASVFGYTPQYSEYKCSRDVLSGDYRIPTFSRAGDTSQSWHLFRVINSDAGHVVHSMSFCQGGVDDTQYNRIFYNTEESLYEADHFYLHFFFGVTAYLPMKPLYDAYDFEEEGKQRVLDVNGVKMN